MAHINLLPWREEHRRQQTREFARQAVLGALLALVAGGYAWYHVNGMIEYQRARNAYLEKQIDILQEEIAAIEELEETKRQLIARMNIIQDLQQRRPQIVHLFYEIPSTLPNGVYLTQITQTGERLVIKGKAESNTLVSSYMRSMDASPWLTDPKLEIIQSSDNPEIQNFILKLKQTVPDTEQSKTASKAEAGGTGDGGGSAS